MSKFIRIAESKFVRVSQNVPQVGNASVDLASHLTDSAKSLLTEKPVVQKTVNPHDVFIKAGVNPNTYVGSAQDNEKLRMQLSKQIGFNMPTFYDAYVKMYGKWDNHPENRISNLNGTNQLRIENDKKKAAQLAEEKKNNDAFSQINPLNTNNPNNVLNLKNPPNHQNLSNTTNHFNGIQNPSGY